MLPTLWVGYNVGIATATTISVVPSFLFFENMRRDMHSANLIGISANTFSVYQINLPLSMSLSNVNMWFLNPNNTSRTVGCSWGLYSLNGSTLSLENSASLSTTFTSNGNLTYCLTFAISKSETLSGGPWYYGFMATHSAAGGIGIPAFMGNSSINPGNAIFGGLVMGRMTVSTTAVPASIATSDLDITGSDAIRQPYILITS